MLYKFLIKQHWRLGIIGFDAPDVVRLLAVDDLHQGQHGVLEESPRRQRPLGGLGDVVSALRPHRLQILIAGVEQKPLEILEERVPVLLNEASHSVDHVASVVLDEEVLAVREEFVHGICPPRTVVIVALQLPVHCLQQHRVRHLPHLQTGLVHQGDDPLVLLVYQLADDDVVEVVDVLPLYSLPLVLLLFLLQYQL